MDAMIVGIGGEMLAEFENGFVVVVCADPAGELCAVQCLAALLDEVIQDPVLKVDDGGGFLAGFKTWLMIGVDVDQRDVKTNCTFENSDEKADRKRRN